ncbi:MAG: matrixin family metalloprotease [Saprospiraceae bacterium]|nr:matrixin family metalloprotease [Saprospiraceae bacterium]
MNEIVGNIASEEFRRNKFLRVLKHELGHMLGLEHMPNTIMDESYTEVDNHELYTIDQVRIIAKVLPNLKKS